jgi:diguanylate cyclase (GGDEF)-like protein
MATRDGDDSDLSHLVEEIQRHLEEGWLGVSEVVERLSPNEIALLRDKPDSDSEHDRETGERMLALVELAEQRRDREPEPWGEVRAAGCRKPLAEHGTVAHEVTRLRLLLVEFEGEDTLHILELLERALDTRFETQSVAGVEQAPARLAEGDFDVALLNLTRSSRGGPALLARAEVATSGVPMIALVNRDDEPKLLHLGVRDYLVKGELDSRLLARTLRGAVEQQRLAEELEGAKRREHFFATRDSLTGLANRHYFRDQLQSALHYAERNGHLLSVLFVDLDRFKQVNDSVGHEVGDSLLVGLAERFIAALRKSDMVARLGGDEFLLLLQGTNSDYAPALIAERLTISLSQPFVVDGQEHVLGASIGIASFPRDGADPDTLIRHADAAMYQVKSEGGGGYRFYSQALNAVTNRKKVVERRLRRVLDTDDLRLVFQPRIDVRDGRIVGAEALLRWTDSELGAVAPAEFIPIAEETGLVSPIGEWVMCRACAEQRAWEALGFPDLRVAVNVSARQIRSQSLRDAVVRAIAETGVHPPRLEIEVAESALLDQRDEAVRVLEELAEIGVGLSLDDFGTGLSSLSYLRRFPVRTLKISHTFVQGMADDPGDASVVEAIVSIARALGLAVVGEAVETAEQRDLLLARGCFEMQGFLFSPPVSAEELRALLTSGGGLLPDDRAQLPNSR